MKGKEWVAVVLAVGIVLAVNVITAAVLYDAIFSEGPGLSDNATQLLTAAFGGIIGVLGAYIGYRVSEPATNTTPTESTPVTATEPAETPEASAQNAA